MNRTIQILSTVCMSLLLFTGCSKNEQQLFRNETGVYFDMSLYSFSFSDFPGQTERRIIVPLKAMGRLSETDRVVRAELRSYDGEDENQMNTANPDYYTILEGVIPANSEMGTFDIDLKYGAELDDEVQRFFVKLIPSEDFPEVEFGSTTLRVEFSAMEMQPVNWTNGYLYIFLGTYSTAYWKFIKQTTGMTVIPFWYLDQTNPDPETYYWNGSEQANVLEIVTLLERALREYNQAHPDDPLEHDDGTKKGQQVVVGE